LGVSTWEIVTYRWSPERRAAWKTPPVRVAKYVSPRFRPCVMMLVGVPVTVAGNDKGVVWNF